jgi:hypothetical protein
MDEVRTDVTVPEPAAIANTGEQCGARHAPRKGKSTGRKKTSEKTRKPARISALLRRVREHRHRAAVLDLLAGEVTSLFSTAMGAQVPQYLIGDERGSVEVADDNVVLGISTKLAAEADASRKALRDLLAKGLDAVRVEDLGDDDRVPEDGDDFVQGRAVTRGHSTCS